ncbi:MAG: group I intron-associated PD-(D/E)XK endonuclease [bacterium]|nr:group I intron-associated PD-(D/E)XK endonuclease [bacterium]
MVELQKKTKGDIAELAVAKKLMEDGWRVLIPYGENHRYDLVVEKDHKFVRIQVKYVTPRNNVLNINCRSSNNWSVLHYSPEEIDIISAYNPHDGEIYFIPILEINRSLFKIRISPAKNNQKLKIHLAKDFRKLKV